MESTIIEHVRNLYYLIRAREIDPWFGFVFAQPEGTIERDEGRGGGRAESLKRCWIIPSPVGAESSNNSRGNGEGGEYH